MLSPPRLFVAQITTRELGEKMRAPDVEATPMDPDPSADATEGTPAAESGVPMETDDAPAPGATAFDAPESDASLPVPPKRAARRDVKLERIVVLEEQVLSLRGKVDILEKLLARVELLEEHTGCSAADV